MAMFPGICMHPIDSATQLGYELAAGLSLDRRRQQQAVLQQVPSVLNGIKVSNQRDKGRLGASRTIQLAEN